MRQPASSPGMRVAASSPGILPGSGAWGAAGPSLGGQDTGHLERGTCQPAGDGGTDLKIRLVLIMAILPVALLLYNEKF